MARILLAQVVGAWTVVCAASWLRTFLDAIGWVDLAVRSVAVVSLFL